MTKAEKLVAKLFQTPQPKDFTWAELLSLMTRARFSQSCTGGSHYTFEHVSGFKLGISRTHPSGILKSYQVKAAKDALKHVDEAGEK